MPTDTANVRSKPIDNARASCPLAGAHADASATRA